MPEYWPSQPVEINLNESDEVSGLVAAHGKSTSDRLMPGQQLNVGQSIISKDGKFELVLQTDGNLVLYNRDSAARDKDLWNTRKFGGKKAVMQKDGNFVVYDGSNRAIWSSATPRHPNAYLVMQNDGNMVIYDKTKAIYSSVTAGGHRPPTKNVISAIGTAAGDIIHTVNAGVNLVAKGLSHIPIVGGALSTVLKVSTSGPAMLERVAKGQRIDHAFVQLGKDELKNVKDVAPYVQKVIAFVPGVGTGVAAAIAAGTALAEGKSVTDALLAAAKGAIPGGALAGSAFDAALKVVKPGVAATVVDAARKALPPQAQKAFDVGTAFAHARNVQSALVTASTKPAAIAAVAKVGQQLAKQAPNVAQAAKGLSSEAAKGFNVGAGLLAHSGVNPHAVIAMRSKLPPAQQAGFDHAAKTLLATVTPHWPSMVVNGIVTRGDWKACRPGAKGCVTGYHVNPITKKVTKGTFTRA
jgi:hypothetical protein